MQWFFKFEQGKGILRVRFPGLKLVRYMNQEDATQVTILGLNVYRKRKSPNHYDTDLCD